VQISWLKANSGHRDYSRLSCGDGKAQLGPSFLSQVSRAGARSLAQRGQRRISADPEMIQPGLIRATPLRTLGWTFFPNGACVWSRPASLRTCSSLPASALRPPRGLGGGWAGRGVTIC